MKTRRFRSVFFLLPCSLVCSACTIYIGPGDDNGTSRHSGPMCWASTDATSIEDYLARYQVAGQPSASHRLYAGLSSEEANHGVSGYMNQFRPEVVSGSFSLMEFAVGCPKEGPVQEQVGIAISVDKVNPFGRNYQALEDNEPRLHIEYIRVINGQVNHKWDGLEGEFVANPIRVHHPGQKVPFSVLDETVTEHLLAIFQSPTGGLVALL